MGNDCEVNEVLYDDENYYVTKEFIMLKPSKRNGIAQFTFTNGEDWVYDFVESLKNKHKGIKEKTVNIMTMRV